jgi:hypothetical protein
LKPRITQLSSPRRAGTVFPQDFEICSQFPLIGRLVCCAGTVHVEIGKTKEEGRTLAAIVRLYASPNLARDHLNISKFIYNSSSSHQLPTRLIVLTHDNQRNGVLTYSNIKTSHPSPSVLPISLSHFQLVSALQFLYLPRIKHTSFLHNTSKPREAKRQTKERPSNYLNQIPPPTSQNTTAIEIESHARASTLDYPSSVDVSQTEETGSRGGGVDAVCFPICVSIALA